MRLRVLIAEDEDAMRRLIIELLRHAGFGEFEFIEARDGLEALERFDPESIDLAFIDWRMPKLKGDELIRRAREKEGGDRVPFIMMTGDYHAPEFIEMRDSGIAAAVLVKPFTLADVRESAGAVIQKVLDRRAEERRAQGLLGRLFHSSSIDRNAALVIHSAFYE